jgi:hypothetical protein
MGTGRDEVCFWFLSVPLVSRRCSSPCARGHIYWIVQTFPRSKAHYAISLYDRVQRASTLSPGSGPQICSKGWSTLGPVGEHSAERWPWDNYGQPLLRKEGVKLSQNRLHFVLFFSPSLPTLVYLTRLQRGRRIVENPGFVLSYVLVYLTHSVLTNQPRTLL